MRLPPWRSRKLMNKKRDRKNGRQTVTMQRIRPETVKCPLPCPSLKMQQILQVDF
jgi:hypothetical protein